MNLTNLTFLYSLTEGKNALDKYTVSNNIKIVYNEVANSFACKVVEGDYYIGDVTHIVKKIENKNYYYG